MKVLAMKIVSQESHPMGDAILDQGYYEMTSEADGKVVTEKARYLQVFKQGKDGQLLLYRDCPLPD
jgi:ketosteroid isomerase-like protein